MQFKLTKKEKSWIFYDVGNSAFVLMVSTILPVYFNYLAQNAGVSDVDYLAYWGYAASISTLIVAVLGPVMGTLADTRGFKKPLFFIVYSGRVRRLSADGTDHMVDFVSGNFYHCKGWI